MKKFSLLTLLALWMLVIVTGCAQPEFNGNRTGNNSQFVMDYTVLSRTETHEMDLQEGDVVNVEIENTSGRLDVQITGPDGQVIYQGDDADSGAFSITIPKTGTYTFSVTGDGARGSVSFIVAGS